MRTGTAAVSQNGLCEIAQVSAAVNRQNILRDEFADGGYDKRDAVHDGILTKTILVGAVKSAFDNMLIFLTRNMREAEGRTGAANRPANRANRA